MTNLRQLERRAMADPEDPAAQAALEHARKRAGRVMAMFRGEKFKVHAFDHKREDKGGWVWWFAACGTPHLFAPEYPRHSKPPLIEEADLNDITCNRCRVSLRLAKTKGEAR